MKHSYLALIQAGRRGVGSTMAERLADALGLAVSERAEFLRLAVQTRAAKTEADKAESLRLLAGEWLLNRVHGDLQPSNLMPLCKSCHDKLWTACVGDAEPQAVAREVLKMVERQPDRRWLLLFLPNRRQALVDCNIRFFDMPKRGRTRAVQKSLSLKEQSH